MNRRNEMIFCWQLLQLQVFLAAAMVGAQTNNTLSVTYNDCELKIYGCTKVVRPMLNDVRYMFPTTLNDVDTMCK
ncbi:hypothetical protein TNCV_1063091 [Trichonephila clavipes]|nr:hypothetical protein TNCV_1063091 [Trichonephila clavipes]